MKYASLLILIPTLLWAQPFEWVQELTGIPVEVNGYDVPVPWTGGYSDTAPEFADIDADGDKDLFLGSDGGYIIHYSNEGDSTTPVWSFVDNQFQGIYLLDYMGHSDPVMIDIDNDGDLDCFSSCARGLVHYWQNQGTSQNPEFVWITDSLEYIDVPGRAHLDFPDIDADGDYDLLIGDNIGHIWYYQNIGTPEVFDFEFVTSFLDSIIVANAASPCFCDIDDDQDFDLFIGNSSGKIWFYQNDGTPQQHDYTLISSNWLGIDVDEYATPEFCDIDADGDYDLFIGKDNDSTHIIPGALHFWRNIGTAQEPQMVLENQMYLTLDFEDGSDPGIIDINFDEKGDLFVHAYYIGWLKDVGTPSSPVFQLQSYNTAGTGFLASSVGYGDLSGDGHEDMVVVHGWTGNVEFWFNNGDTLNPGFYPISSFSIGQMAGGPELADMDADGDNDLIVHVSSYQFDPYIYYYENQGDPQHFDFILTTMNYQGWAGSYTVLSVLDFDEDGDFDIVAEVDTTSVMVYLQNIGTPQNAIFAPPYLNFIIPDSLYYHICDFCDVDHDGDMDAFFGSTLGGIRFFRNVTGEPAVPLLRRHPQAGLHLSLGPNPANPVTWVTFNLPAPQKATLAVYNLLGQKVATLAQGLQPPGTNTYLWNAAGFASGVYMVRLEVDKDQQVGKVVVLR